MPDQAAANPIDLAQLRREIDAIDSEMHALLMKRGEIIDRLIAVKKTSETGSAFRPAREASMMHGLVERHHGILPIDTVESIWRVIISTFTYVQAPYSVHLDVHPGEAEMRDAARFHFGFTVPIIAHDEPEAAIGAVAASRGDLALVHAGEMNEDPWWLALTGADAPKVIARLPFVERDDHPVALTVYAVSNPVGEAGAAELALYSVEFADAGEDIDLIEARLAEAGLRLVDAFSEDDRMKALVETDGAATARGIAAALAARGFAGVGDVAWVGSHARSVKVG
ncbi:MAG: chorismate mutase [Hyphomicrobiaceae bacterium]|nr:chorismate mutase [Hyphomicrobiaceae bacterium]